MNSNIRMAREMLRIAKELATAGQYQDFQNERNFLKNPTFQNYKNRPKQKSAEEDDLSDSTMDKVAEELLAVANELLNDKGE